MAEISAQDAHWAMDCRGGKSFHRIIELEIGSRPEIRRELNLINRNLHFITMTGKRSMTDILVSNRSELTHELSKQTLNEKKTSSGANPCEMAARESCSCVQSSVQNLHTIRRRRSAGLSLANGGLKLPCHWSKAKSSTSASVCKF